MYKEWKNYSARSLEIRRAPHAHTYKPFSKGEGTQHIAICHNWKVESVDGYTFVKGPWYSVHDNFFDRINSEYLGEY